MMKFPKIPKDERRRVDAAMLATIAGLVAVLVINQFFPMGRYLFLAVVSVHVFVAGWVQGTMGVYHRRMKKAVEVSESQLRRPTNRHLH